MHAVCSVREIQQVWVYIPNPDHAQRFVQEISGAGSIPKNLRAVSSLPKALKDGEIFDAATTSTTPVISF